MGTGVHVPGLDRIPSPAALRWRRDRWFFSGLALLSALLVFAGFARSYYLKTAYGTPELSTLLHVHGAFFSTWIVLLVAQTTLVAVKRTDLHRQLGVAGGVLAALMTVLAVAVGIDGARRAGAPDAIPALAFLTTPLATVVVFPVLVSAALYWRRQPDIHKRLMLIATAELVTAGVARIPGVGPGGPVAYFGITDSLILLMWGYDYFTRGRVHPAALWGGLFLIASQPLRLAISGTGTWLAIARWMTA